MLSFTLTEIFSRMWCFSFFFFFQAEDGIRDKLVTGVQTCALPIYGRGGREQAGGVRDRHRPAWTRAAQRAAGRRRPRVAASHRARAHTRRPVRAGGGREARRAMAGGGNGGARRVPGARAPRRGLAADAPPAGPRAS